MACTNKLNTALDHLQLIKPRSRTSNMQLPLHNAPIVPALLPTGHTIRSLQHKLVMEKGRPESSQTMLWLLLRGAVVAPLQLVEPPPAQLSHTSGRLNSQGTCPYSG